ncbi:MAG: branched-chain alpha-keto acid dehydrogenase subunit E2 [Euryarchaeota archaeon]|nr:branched-chain alpha-keto acid dehydrogenase subunit E2 [Euryarchaeota archaeon]
MGTYEFRLPDIGEGVVEGEIVTWHVKVGDTVREDDPLLEVMTDKASVEIPSPVDGTITSTTGAPGDIIPVGQVCIVFDVEGEGNSKGTTPEPEATPEPVKAAPKPAPAPTPDPAPATPIPKQANTGASGKPLASPAVRQRARQAGIDLHNVSGSGPAGRITHADIDAQIAGISAPTPLASPSPTVAARGVKRTSTEEVPVIGLRRKIAENMAESKRSIPHFSYFEEVDVTELEALRQHLNATKADDQPKLTYLPFIMLALSKIMPNHPECNAHYDDEANVVTRHGAVHLGIATQTDRGLYVPVVKHVEAMDVWTAAAEMQRVSGAARSGSAALEDLSGSTFTITSLGRDGGLGATPIINKPEVSILGVHKANERPLVYNGRIEIRRVMNLSSSFDHRVVDGADGAALIQHLKRMLEHPATIFM